MGGLWHCFTMFYPRSPRDTKISVHAKEFDQATGSWKLLEPTDLLNSSRLGRGFEDHPKRFQGWKPWENMGK